MWDEYGSYGFVDLECSQVGQDYGWSWEFGDIVTQIDGHVYHCQDV